jgi:hypothetical protein
VNKLLDLFLDSNILIKHFCQADDYLCTEQLLDKIEKGDYNAWISDFVYSETLGELKNDYEKKRRLKPFEGEFIPKPALEKMIGTIEDFKKTPNLKSTTIPLDQTMIYDRVRTLCIEAKDAPVVMCVEYLEKTLGRQVYLVTADMRSLFFKVKRLVRPLHPSFHMEECKTECPSYHSCQWRNRFTKFR